MRWRDKQASCVTAIYSAMKRSSGNLVRGGRWAPFRWLMTACRGHSRLIVLPEGGMVATTSIKWIKKHGSTARGKRELVAFLKGETLTMKESILANCYECTGFYMDGRRDCEVEGCPLHVFMPYRKGGAVKSRKVSEETEAKMRKARERKAQKVDSVAVG